MSLAAPSSLAPTLGDDWYKDKGMRRSKFEGSLYSFRRRQGRWNKAA